MLPVSQLPVAKHLPKSSQSLSRMVDRHPEQLSFGITNHTNQERLYFTQTEPVFFNTTLLLLSY